MSSITYRITPKNPAAHLFEVVLTIKDPAPQQTVWLPVWIPGSYLVREFARHFVSVDASTARGAAAVTKTDKHSWCIDTNGDGSPDAPLAGAGATASQEPTPPAPCPPVDTEAKPISTTSMAILWAPATAPPRPARWHWR